jgi:hypothetical protein
VCEVGRELGQIIIRKRNDPYVPRTVIMSDTQKHFFSFSPPTSRHLSPKYSRLAINCFPAAYQTPPNGVLYTHTCNNRDFAFAFLLLLVFSFLWWNSDENIRLYAYTQSLFWKGVIHKMNWAVYHIWRNDGVTQEVIKKFRVSF